MPFLYEKSGLVVPPKDDPYFDKADGRTHMVNAPLAPALAPVDGWVCTVHTLEPAHIVNHYCGKYQVDLDPTVWSRNVAVAGLPRHTRWSISVQLGGCILAKYVHEKDSDTVRVWLHKASDESKDVPLPECTTVDGALDVWRHVSPPVRFHRMRVTIDIADEDAHNVRVSVDTADAAAHLATWPIDKVNMYCMWGFTEGALAHVREQGVWAQPNLRLLTTKKDAEAYAAALTSRGIEPHLVALCNVPIPEPGNVIRKYTHEMECKAFQRELDAIGAERARRLALQAV